jgi:hypothetical protein
MEVFKNLSIRARVAYGICCLEEAIKYYCLLESDWDFMMNLLWTYTNKNIGKWHEIMAECSPDSVLEELSYQDKGIINISIKEYEELRFLYSKSNKVCDSIINLIFEIGTRDLYSSIVNGSPDTIEYLQEIIILMQQNNIPLPDIEIFKKFPITENHGWGREFTRNAVFGD